MPSTCRRGQTSSAALRLPHKHADVRPTIAPLIAGTVRHWWARPCRETCGHSPGVLGQCNATTPALAERCAGGNAGIVYRLDS